jgi:hypothetical protein
MELQVTHIDIVHKHDRHWTCRRFVSLLGLYSVLNIEAWTGYIDSVFFCGFPRNFPANSGISNQTMSTLLPFSISSHQFLTYHPSITRCLSYWPLSALSTYVGGFEMIIAQLATDLSVSTYVRGFEIIIAQLAIDRSVSTYVGVLRWSSHS